MPIFTKEERVLIALYKIKGIVSHVELCQESKVGPKSIKGICKALMRMNFIRKRGEEHVEILPLGVTLVEELLGS